MEDRTEGKGAKKRKGGEREWWGKPNVDGYRQGERKEKINGRMKTLLDDKK